MKIILNNISKRYNKRWVFRNITHEIPPASCIGICGPNGSGKSTLLKIISTIVSPSKGSVKYFNFHKKIDEIDIPEYISFVAPYQNIIEEFTLLEHLEFHSHFKKFCNPIPTILKKSGLIGHKNDLVKEFSSGMLQRLKLAMAFHSESEILLMDEPTTNLDITGIKWYQNELNDAQRQKTIIIASNQEFELINTEKKIFLQ